MDADAAVSTATAVWLEGPGVGERPSLRLASASGGGGLGSVATAGDHRSPAVRSQAAETQLFPAVPGGAEAASPDGGSCAAVGVCGYRILAIR